MEARRTSTAARETPLDVRRSSLRIKEDTEPEIVDGGRKSIDGNQRDITGRSGVESEIVNNGLRSFDGNQRDTAR